MCIVIKEIIMLISLYTQKRPPPLILTHIVVRDMMNRPINYANSGGPSWSSAVDCDLHIEPVLTTAYRALGMGQGQ